MDAVDVLCFSHSRWQLVFERPHHLMTRCARRHRVFFIEAPMYGSHSATLERSVVEIGVVRVVPQLPSGLDASEEATVVGALLERMHVDEEIEAALHWVLSPSFLPYTRDLPRVLTIYDCMYDTTARGASAEQLALEQELIAESDLMLTDGMALLEKKRDRHPSVHGIPSGVDLELFRAARSMHGEPADQAHLPRPRIGYCGVIDERIDLELLTHVADSRPDFQLVMVGPVLNVAHERLPRRPNLNFLGPKAYTELPGYVAGWDVGIVPFALDEATVLLHPTNAAEYLAAGLPVVSTAVREIVEPYERLGLVRVARDRTSFTRAIELALGSAGLATPEQRDAFLVERSWDGAWSQIERLVEEARANRRRRLPARRSFADRAVVG